MIVKRSATMKTTIEVMVVIRQPMKKLGMSPKCSWSLPHAHEMGMEINKLMNASIDTSIKERAQRAHRSLRRQYELIAITRALHLEVLGQDVRTRLSMLSVQIGSDLDLTIWLDVDAEPQRVRNLAQRLSHLVISHAKLVKKSMTQAKPYVMPQMSVETTEPAQILISILFSSTYQKCRAPSPAHRTQLMAKKIQAVHSMVTSVSLNDS
jgi:hypothetical protein